MRNVIRIGIVVIVCASLIVGYYFYLSRRGTSVENILTGEQSEFEKLLDRDMILNYPPTPRETIKFYNRILKLYYDPNTTDEQVEDLCDQAMMLFDPALLQQNPRDLYVAAVKGEISDFKERNKKIVTTDVCDTSDVIYKKRNGDDMAYVLAYYYITEGSEGQVTYQKYALRKDDFGNYKILAFELSDENGD